MNLRRVLVALVAMLAGVLIPVISIASPASATTPLTYSAQVTIPAPPSSNFSGASAGGDGWGLAFTSTQVFNVFHHQQYLGVNCHNTADASPCWPSVSYKTITDGSGNGFTTSGQPGVYIDQATGHLYVFATRLAADSSGANTAGVVCIDTTQPATVADPFCGFTALSAVGDAPYSSIGYSGVTDPVLVGSDWYAFDTVAGTPTGTRDQVMCFDVATGAACAGQPYAVTLGTGSVGGAGPSPSIALIGGKVIIPVPTNSSATELTCFDPSTELTCSGGSWPIAVSSHAGAPFARTDASGTTTGFCLPISGDPCYDLNANSVSTPANLAAAVTGSATWNGPGTVLGASVYVPNGNTNSIDCYDYATAASCANFPKVFSNLGLLYTVTPDPFIPTCLWVNSDDGSEQIQNFDAISGGSCAQAPLRVQASSFVAPSDVCIPASFTSLQVLSPVPSAYTRGTVDFEDANYVPIPGVATHTLDSSGMTRLTDLNLPTTDALPQFVVTLSGLSGSPGAVTLNITWSGSYSPACVTPTATVTTATVPGPPTAVGASGGIGSDDVSWTTPSSDGFSPITSYVVTAYNPAGDIAGTCTAISPATSCIVRGLASATLYSFSVVANNVIGASSPATATGYAGTTTPPDAPTGVSATPGDGSATASWTAPSGDGGEPVTSYTVTATDARGVAAGSCTAVAPTTSCTVNGLSNGADYVFSVVAVNAVGPSVASGASSSVTPVARVRTAPDPGAPTSITSVLQATSGGTGSLMVSWVLPSGGGSSTESYVVTVEPGGETCTTTGTSCLVSGVPLGVSYTYTVTAFNQSGAIVSATMSALSPRLSSNIRALALSPSYAPVVITCRNSECLGIANVSVARRLFSGGKQVGWRHLILGRASFELKAGQKLTLHMIDTLIGRIVLPRQVTWWLARRPKFRLTLTTVMLGSATSHRPVFLR
ncbi:MAG TPA: fibronectin type III domain-containing protein [Acidimicrobiales bacterium]